MEEGDKLLIKNLKTKLNNNNNNNLCAFITIESNELKRLLKIIEKEEVKK